MISVVDQDQSKRDLLDLCRQSPFGCKIAAIALAYGFDKRFSMFWMDDAREAAYCLVDDTMIISGTVVQPAEAASFVRLSGAKTLIGAIRNLERMGLKPLTTGAIVQKDIRRHLSPPPAMEDAPIREMYRLLEDAGLLKDEFEAFYLDLSHRLRHQIAQVVTKYVEGKLVGCGVISAITPGTAILSALAVEKSFRKKGYGKELLARAEELLNGKTLFVFTDSPENTRFYQSRGFRRLDTWVEAAVDQRGTASMFRSLKPEEPMTQDPGTDPGTEGESIVLTAGHEKEPVTADPGTEGAAQDGSESEGTLPDPAGPEASTDEGGGSPQPKPGMKLPDPSAPEASEASDGSAQSASALSKPAGNTDGGTNAPLER